MMLTGETEGYFVTDVTSCVTGLEPAVIGLCHQFTNKTYFGNRFSQFIGVYLHTPVTVFL